jgi:hypothetical protein
VVKPAGEVGGILGPQSLEDLKIFVADRAPLPEVRRLQRFKLLAQPTDAHPDGDATLRQHVHSGQHFGGEHRVAVGQNHHAGDQAQGLGDAGDEGHER